MRHDTYFPSFRSRHTTHSCSPLKPRLQFDRCNCECLSVSLSLTPSKHPNLEFKNQTVAASAMVALKTSAPENLNIPEQMQQGKTLTLGGQISEYELCREERIRENRERMQKLGIFDLSQKLNANKPNPVRATRPKAPRLHSPLPPSSPGPVRRSSRLQSSTPVSYCELRVEKNGKSSKEINILREEGSKPEFYTEEHEKALGSTEMSWTLFVDGYGKDGKRIYDPVKGKTCHQCRQKTLGHHTHCSNCKMVQGQFCGDCLYMRYGENVLEAEANPQWTCPVCRGICNCSLCRNAKGWLPTGMLYKKVASLGYKSVAHYLIQTRRANTDTENNVGSKVPVSAKRSLPFSDIEVTGEEDDDLSKASREVLNPDPLPVSDQESGDGKLAEPLLNPAEAALMKDQVENSSKPEHEEDSAGCKDDKENILLAGSELDKSSICVTVVEPKATEPLNDEVILPEAPGDVCEIEKENSVVDKDVVASETSPKSTKKRARCEPTPDSIAGRLRRRRNGADMNGELQVVNANHTRGITKDTSTAAVVEGIATRLRKRCRV